MSNGMAVTLKEGGYMAQSNAPDQISESIFGCHSHNMIYNIKQIKLIC